ncbi:MAG: hypothetical protein OEZ01_14095 [Candidatus Heimdallarchaeota archaeon]|nr:hypothetical protein [Candidatus Heimdallarchaeota archaeon]MDH5647138.1 hypothetical protein [Candidatus Heimdallarchaeota archaeon]
MHAVFSLKNTKLEIDLTHFQNYSEPLLVILKFLKYWAEINPVTFELIPELTDVFINYGKVISDNLIPIVIMLERTVGQITTNYKHAEIIYTLIDNLAKRTNAEYIQTITS